MKALSATKVTLKESDGKDQLDREVSKIVPGDVVTIRPRANVLKLYQAIREQGVEGEGCEWVTLDTDTLTATVQGNPAGSDISLPVDANTVVEFLSR